MVVGDVGENDRHFHLTPASCTCLGNEARKAISIALAQSVARSWSSSVVLGEI